LAIWSSWKPCFG